DSSIRCVKRHAVRARAIIDVLDRDAWSPLGHDGAAPGPCGRGRRPVCCQQPRNTGNGPGMSETEGKGRLTSAPVLETQRTILRPHRLEDFDAYCAMGIEPAVFRFIGGRARSREESWQRLLRHPGMWSLLGFGFWAVEDKRAAV